MKRARLLMLIIGGCFVLVGAVFFDRVKRLCKSPYRKIIAGRKR